MVKAKKIKAADRQQACKKLTRVLKKRYQVSLPKEKPVLETLLFAICLEDATVPQAEESFRRLNEDFFDLNEVRVSSISELAIVFRGSTEPEKRALQVRNVLHDIFEKNFSFDFEGLKKKTADLALKQLKRIRNLSSFVRSYVLQYSLDSHVIPIDESMKNAAIWFGFANLESTAEDVADFLKPALRKSDAKLFCLLLNSLATDQKLQFCFSEKIIKKAKFDFDLFKLTERLEDAIKESKKRPRKKVVKKTVPKKKTVKKTGKKSASKKSSSKVTNKKPAKKTSKKKKKIAKKKKKTGTSKKKTLTKRKKTRRSKN